MTNYKITKAINNYVINVDSRTVNDLTKLADHLEDNNFSVLEIRQGRTAPKGSVHVHISHKQEDTQVQQLRKLLDNYETI